MKETEIVAYCKNLFNTIGRYEKIYIIKHSSLDNRERAILYKRFVEGKSIKESSYEMGLEEPTFNKSQQRAFIKLYKWLEYKKTL